MNKEERLIEKMSMLITCLCGEISEPEFCIYFDMTDKEMREFLEDIILVGLTMFYKSKRTCRMTDIKNRIELLIERRRRIRDN